MKKPRRDVLKTLGTVSVWSAPVIQAVVLPAHAQTSAVTTTPSAPTTTTTEDPGMALLHISAVLPNPVGGDCGISAREMVSISNAGNASADLSGHRINRITSAGTETLVSLSGTISPGQTIDYDVCQGTTAGTSARLHNKSGGVVFLEGGSGVIDIVQYPPVLNGPAEGTVISYGPTPSTGSPRGG